MNAFKNKVEIDQRLNGVGSRSENKHVDHDIASYP